MSKKVSIIKGKHIILREVTYKDVDRIVSWRNDKNLGKFLGTEKLTKKKQCEFLKHYFERDNDFYFIAEMIAYSKPIGTVAIFDIDYASKRAEFGRLLVLNNCRMFSFEISYLALKFAFETLKLHKVYGGVQKENIKALRFDLSLGFHKEGILKEHWWNGQKLDDVILAAMFEDDYIKLKEKYQRLVEKRKLF